MGKSFEDMTVAELRDRLRARGLKVSGNKPELIARLRDTNATTPKNVINKKLYIQIREQVKNSVEVWPSAYASSMISRRYKEAGGKYRKGESTLRRWHKEKWVNVCVEPNTPCGESPDGKYPYCRPSVRVTKDTPMTVGEIKKKHGNAAVKKLCNEKRKKAQPRKGRARYIRPTETQRRKK